MIKNYLGIGIGLRAPHYEHFLNETPAVDWLEIISDNFIDAHEGYWAFLADLRARYPIVMHGVSLSIGGIDPIDQAYVKKLKKLADFLETPWISDHVCFTQVANAHSHDLLPVPYTEEAIKHLSQRIIEVQDILQQPLVLENPSSYLAFAASTMTEADFLVALHHETNCKLLLDVNNVYVSAFNHGFDAKHYIDTIPTDAIQQIHLAGHTDKGDYLFDTHDALIKQDVWALYEYTVARKGLVSTLIEWDQNIPPLTTLLDEVGLAKAYTKNIFEQMDCFDQKWSRNDGGVKQCTSKAS